MCVASAQAPAALPNASALQVAAPAFWDQIQHDLRLFQGLLGGIFDEDAQAAAVSGWGSREFSLMKPAVDLGKAILSCCDAVENSLGAASRTAAADTHGKCPQRTRNCWNDPQHLVLLRFGVYQR